MKAKATAAEVTERNYLIQRSRAKGFTVYEIAKKFDLAPSSVSRILRSAYRKRIKEIHKHAQHLLASILDGYEEDMRELAGIAANEGEPGAVRVGALKGRTAARTAAIAVMQSLGLVAKVPEQTWVSGPGGGPIIIAGGSEEEYIAALRLMRKEREERGNGASDHAAAADRR